MRRSTKWLMSLTVVASLAGFTGAAIAATMISQADMEAAFKGKSFKDDDGAGNVGVITYGADGTISVKVATGAQAPEDSGTYKFDKGGYCSSWKKLRSGTEACFTASKEGNGYQLWKADGKKDDMLTPQ
jgi:hypothetical protein